MNATKTAKATLVDTDALKIRQFYAAIVAYRHILDVTSSIN